MDSLYCLNHPDLEEQGGPAFATRMLLKAMRMLHTRASGSNAAIVFTTTVRNAAVTPLNVIEGTVNPLKYYSSVRITMVRDGDIRIDGEPAGIRVKARVIKNMLAAYRGDVVVDCLHDQGFCPENDIFDMAVEAGIIDRDHSMYRYRSWLLGQGRLRSIEQLKVETSVRDEIAGQIP